MQKILKFLHMTDFFSTGTACDACVKYDDDEGGCVQNVLGPGHGYHYNTVSYNLKN